jgi:hypothetical protein
MADAGSAIQPLEVAGLTCPRCWFSGGPFIPSAALTFLCGRCEWPFTLAAPAVSAPAVPATTVPVTNTTGTVVAAAISANGATITNVSVNGSTAGTAAGTYLIPVAGTISITYTVATPTWTWALPTISAGVSAGGTALPFTAFGTSFALGQVLIVDPSGTSDVVVVNGTPTGTSVPVNSLNSAHNSGVSVTVAALTPALSGAGLENVPATAY